MEQFVLGPLQTQWIQSLRDHPERQMISRLGQKYPDGSYKACCLGEAGLIAGVCYWTEDGILSTRKGDKNLDGSSGDVSVLNNGTYKAMGLKSPWGHTVDVTIYNGTTMPGEFSMLSLSWLNDQGITWPEIADIIMKDPSQYFTEPK